MDFRGSDKEEDIMVVIFLQFCDIEKLEKKTKFETQFDHQPGLLQNVMPNLVHCPPLSFVSPYLLNTSSGK
jgi:hypothetical protein